MGEVLDKAQELLAAVAEGIQSVIDAAMAAINAAIAAIQEVAGQITTMIEREIAAITDALQNMLNLSSTFSFMNIFNHPCAKVVLGAVGTGGLLAVLNR